MRTHNPSTVFLCMLSCLFLAMSSIDANLQTQAMDAERVGLLTIDETVLEKVELNAFEEEVRRTVDGWLEDGTLEEIEKRRGRGMRRDAIKGTPEEQLRAQCLLLEIADRIADQFPEVRKNDDNPVTYSAGRALVEAGRYEVGLETLLREANCLRAPAMIVLETLYRYGISDEDGKAGIQPHNNRILEYWQAMSALGISRAQLVLGQFYYEGVGVAADKRRGIVLMEESGMAEAKMVLAALFYQENEREKAAAWWSKAAEDDNDAVAWHNLAVLALEDKRFDKALVFCRNSLAADPKYNPARIDLGRMYLEGWGVKRNLHLAANLMRVVLRTEREDAKTRALAEYNLGIAMRKMRGPSEGELVGKFRDTLERVDRGDPAAMTELGKMYANGRGTETDPGKAVGWFRKAADAGDVEAMWCLGAACDRGAGVEADRDKAIEWYLKAAEGGNPKAMFNLGQMYAHGKGVEMDGPEAVEWYKKAVAAGSVNALYALGAIYADGRALPQDYGECIKWYRKAANAGHSEAITYLGVRYMEGQGLEQDQDVAAEWFRKAAHLGNTKGMLLLAGCHHHGIGVPQDLSETYVWLSLAIRFGSLDAYRHRDDIVRELTEEQQSAADRQVDELFEQIQAEH